MRIHEIGVVTAHKGEGSEMLSGQVLGCARAMLPTSVGLHFRIKMGAPGGRRAHIEALWERVIQMKAYIRWEMDKG